MNKYTKRILRFAFSIAVIVSVWSTLGPTNVLTTNRTKVDEWNKIQHTNRKEDAFEDFICTQEQRMKKLYKNCPNGIPTFEDIDNLNDTEVWKLADLFFVAENLKTITCIHKKVGWTTQRVVLANNSAPRPLPSTLSEQQIWDTMDSNNFTKLWHPKYSTADIRYRLKHYFKYMFVRHPFSRLVSAHRNKLVVEMEKGKTGYWTILLPILIDWVRPELKGVPLEHIRLPFVDILRFLKAGGYDMHFAGPYELKCHPCIVKYDFIGKIETFDNDMDFIIESKFPAKRGKSTKFNSNNPNGNRKHPGLFREKLYEYDNISSELVEFVKEKYRRDFVQFGYDVQYEGSHLVATCTGGCC